MTAPELIAVPNVSEGRDRAAVDAIAAAFEAGGDARVLDVHVDADHHRSVFTLAGAPGRLSRALRSGAREVLERVDLRRHEGLHPYVGALDVVPVVFRDEAERGAACAEALTAGSLLGDGLGLPVVLYGALTEGRVTRAAVRRGGWRELDRRLRAGEVLPDFGPARAHPSAGAVLVAARPPLLAFNLELARPATEADAKRIAARIREGGEDGLPGVRALGLTIRGDVAQVTCNVEDHRAVPLVRLLDAVRAHAPVSGAEVVGLSPAAAFQGWPDDVPTTGRRTLEDALGT